MNDNTLVSMAEEKDSGTYMGNIIFTCEMFKRFCDWCSANPFEFLTVMKQEGSIDDYVEQFERLASHVGNLSEEQYLEYFLNGLKENIRRTV